MTIAHLSDTHLGFAAFGRSSPRGLNQRSEDVMASFKSALDAVADRDPDLVVHAGDLFHRVSPTNFTIVTTFRLLSAFQARRGFRPFILIGGNHDTPNAREVGCILHLFRMIQGVEVAVDEAKSLDFEDVEVLCVPDRAARADQVELSPQLGRRHGVLVRHGSVREVLPKQADLPSIATIPAERWSYVALGDYHDFRTFGPNCAFAGATDYCTNDIWAERVAKGWIWFDTDSSRLELVPLPTRAVYDLEPIDASGLDAAGVLGAARERAVWAEGEQPMVRQRVVSLHPEVAKTIARYTFEAQMLDRCLHYQLDLRSDQAQGVSPLAERPTAIPLEFEWEAHVERLDVPPLIEREVVKSCGLGYLKRANDEADPA